MGSVFCTLRLKYEIKVSVWVGQPLLQICKTKAAQAWEPAMAGLHYALAYLFFLQAASDLLFL